MPSPVSQPSPPLVLSPARPKTSALSASLLMMAGLGVSTVIGLLRTQLITRTFGTSALSDAFSAANNLPELLYTILAGGALSLAYIPVYSGVLKQDRTQANRLFSQVLSVLVTAAAAAALLVAIFAEPLVRSSWGVAPNFDPATQRLCAHLMQLLAVGTVLFCVSSLVSATLQANQHFLSPAIVPSLYSVGQIIGVLFFTPRFGIYGLAYGVILGAALHLFAQLPALWRQGVRWQGSPNWRDPNLLRIGVLMLPRIGDLFLARFSIGWLNTNIASSLDAGRVAALQYAFQLMNMPWTLIGTAIGIAVFPTLAALNVTADRSAQRAALDQALRAVITLAIPAAVGLVLVGQPLVALLFQRGDFTAQSTQLVVLALQCYTVALVSQSLLDIVVRAYAARQDTLTPLLVSLFTTALNIGLALLLVKTSLQHGGLALANGLAVLVEVTLGLLILFWRDRLVDLTSLGGQVLRVGLAAAVMFGATYATLQYFNLHGIAALGVGLLLGSVVYSLAGLLLGIREVKTLPQLLWQNVQARWLV
jgi:putative peptidoglycan lipid II flippase